MIGELYSILKREQNEVTIKLSDANHLVFKGHFPTIPLLPGYLLIDIISSILNDNVINIHYSKFVVSVYPNDEIQYNIKYDNKIRIIKITKDCKKIGEIKYETK